MYILHGLFVFDFREICKFLYEVNTNKKIIKRRLKVMTTVISGIMLLCAYVALHAIEREAKK